MKTIKTFLLQLYLNWFGLAVIGILIGKWLFGLSLIWLFAPPIVLVVFTLISITESFSFLRFITWPLIKHYFFGKVKKLSPLLSFPYLIWLELEGREIYIKGGDAAFRQAFVKYGDKVCQSLTEFSNQLKSNT